MNKNLNDNVTYWCYVDANRPTDIVFSDIAGLTITIHNLKENFNFPTQLQELSFQKIKGKELHIDRFNLNSLVIKNSGFTHFFLKDLTLNFKDIDYSLKLKGQEVSLDEAYTLLQEKNVLEILEKLLNSKTKSEHHFSYGQQSMMKYFCQNEDKLNQFKNLFVNDQFSLPDDILEQEDLFKYIEQEEPGCSLFISENIPTKSQRIMQKQTASIKKHKGNRP